MGTNFLSIVDFDAFFIFETLLEVENKFYKKEKFHGLEVDNISVNTNGFIDGHNINDTDNDINENVIDCFAFIVITNGIFANHSIPSYSTVLNFKLYLRSSGVTFFSDCF